MVFNEITNFSTAHLIQFGSQYSLQKAYLTSNLFWKETLHYFVELLVYVKPKCDTDVLLEPLWFENITVQSHCIFYKPLYEKGFYIFL